MDSFGDRSHCFCCVGDLAAGQVLHKDFGDRLYWKPCGWLLATPVISLFKVGCMVFEGDRALSLQVILFNGRSLWTLIEAVTDFNRIKLGQWLGGCIYPEGCTVPMEL